MTVGSPILSGRLAETHKRYTDLTPQAMSPVKGTACKKIELTLRVPQTLSGAGSPKLVSNRRDMATTFESEPINRGIERISPTSYHLDDFCEAEMPRPWQTPFSGLRDVHMIESALRVSKI